jgi:hypothetical protein
MEKFVILMIQIKQDGEMEVVIKTVNLLLSKNLTVEMESGIMENSVIPMILLMMDDEMEVVIKTVSLLLSKNLTVEMGM